MHCTVLVSCSAQLKIGQRPGYICYRYFGVLEQPIAEIPVYSLTMGTLCAVLLWILIVLCTSAQQTGIRVYGDSTVINDAIFTAGGELLMTGVQSGNTVVMRCDAEGGLIQRKKYACQRSWTAPPVMSVPLKSEGFAIVETASGYVVAGRMEDLYANWSHELFELRLDPNLDTTGLDVFYSDGVRTEHIQAAFLDHAGSELLLSGHVATLNGQRGFSELAVPEGFPIYYDHWITDGHRRGDHSVLAAAYFDIWNGTGYGPNSVLLFGPNDSLIATACLDNPLYNSNPQVVISKDTTVLLVDDEYITALSSNLMPLWSWHLGSAHEIRDVHARTDGSFLLAYDDDLLVQLSSTGGLDWIRQYGIASPGRLDRVFTNNADDRIYLLGNQLSGGSYLIIADSIGTTAQCDVPPPSLSFNPNSPTTYIGCAHDLGSDVFLEPEFFEASATAQFSSLPADCGQFSPTSNATGTVFWDVNLNQIQDAGEATIPFYGIDASPLGTTFYTNDLGQFSVTAADGAYTISLSTLPSLFYLTTDSSAYTFSFTPNDTLFAGLDFGIAATVDTSILDPTFALGSNPCGGPGFSNAIVISNEGSVVDSGYLAVTVDTIQGPVSSLQADSIIGTTMYFSFGPLYPFASQQFEFDAFPPGIWGIGNNAVNYVDVFRYDTTGTIQLATTDTVQTLITCAYDPNDKQVSPFGVDSAHIVDLSTSSLDYLIRFQNTGNDTALRVLILDELPQELERTSLRLNGSSHSITDLTLSSSGLLEVEFDNIYLPDSNVNEPASRGWVSFTLDVVQGQPNGTRISNTAGIYFDYNPPIVTNNAFVTLVDCALFPGLGGMNFNSAGGYIELINPPSFDHFSYQWYLDGNPIIGGIGWGTQLQAFGTYQLVYTNEFGCEQWSDPWDHLVTGLSANDAGRFSVFPNPARDELNVLLNTRDEAINDVVLFDMRGRLIDVRAEGYGFL